MSLPPVDYTNPIIRRCDKVMVFSFYAMIYFLPIAPAILQWCFGFILLSYFVKRAVVFSQALRGRAAQESRLGFFQRLGLFFQSYAPVPDSLKLNAPIGLYIYFAFISVIMSQDIAFSMKAFVFKLLKVTYLYFLFNETMRTTRRLKIFLTIFLISASLIIVNGIFQYFVRTEFIHFQPITDGRVTSSFKHANDLAAYLLIVIPVFFHLSRLPQFLGMHQTSSVEKNDDRAFGFLNGLKFQHGAGFMFILGLACLGVTYSRAAWLALGVCFLISGLRNKRMLVLWLAGAVVFAGLFVPKMIRERQANIQEGGIWTMSGRDTYWQEAVALIKKDPLSGVGLNTYTRSVSRWSGYPHNCYLQMGAEIGLAGLAAFLWIFFRFFKNGVRTLGQAQGRLSSRLLIGFLIGYGAFLIQSFFDTSFYSNQLGMLMWLVMGLTAATASAQLEKAPL